MRPRSAKASFFSLSAFLLFAFAAKAASAEGTTKTFDDALREGVLRASEDLERDGWESWHAADLNRDGVDDVFLANPEHCTDKGCPTWLFMSTGDRFVPALHVVADDCWEALDSVAGHLSVDCLQKLDGGVPVVVRFRWNPEPNDARKLPYEGGLPALAEIPVQCTQRVVLRSARVGVLPRTKMRVLRTPREEEVGSDPVREFTDRVRGDLGVVWFEPDSDDAYSVWSFVARGKEIAPPPSAFLDELAVGSKFTAKVSVKDDAGIAWLGRERDGQRSGWVREADTGCLAR